MAIYRINGMSAQQWADTAQINKTVVHSSAGDFDFEGVFAQQLQHFFKHEASAWVAGSWVEPRRRELHYLLRRKK